MSQIDFSTGKLQRFLDKRDESFFEFINNKKKATIHNDNPAKAKEVNGKKI